MADATPPPRYLFVTGKLAESSLRQILVELAPKVGFEAEIAVLPITVAALLTTDWTNRKLIAPPNIDKVILPGFCRGELQPLADRLKIPVERGPTDLRDLPTFFGQTRTQHPRYGEYTIEILGEINHAPKLSPTELLSLARRYRDHGANIIDLGCDPGPTWPGVAAATAALVADGHRVSVDSFNPIEVGAALGAGAELVLSVNSTNRHHAREWADNFGNFEVVAIPDTPTELETLYDTIDWLQREQIAYRVDPIVEPIGFGFAQSLGRYLEVRRRYPDANMLMGIGNLTELTDVDSAGVNVMLAGFCEELGIRSVLTTEVVNWCSTSIREFDFARKLVHHAVREKVLPKRLDANLIMLRDARHHDHSEENLRELAANITDRNYRLFAERGELHIMNASVYLRGTDPFLLFAQLLKSDPKLDASHAFYLGYEFAKAVTALTLGKQYHQDRALTWGFLTLPENGHRNPGTLAES